MKNRIIWLQPERFTGGLRALAHKQMQSVGLTPTNFQEILFPNKWKKYIGKEKWIADPKYKRDFQALISRYSPDLVLVNSEVALAYLTNNRYNSLAMTRGSVYETNEGKTVWFVLDSITKFHKIKWGPWILRKDFEKLGRWINGNQKTEPRFNYQVCDTLNGLQNLRNRIQQRSLLVGVDIETTGVGRNAQISSISYTTWSKNGTVSSWVVPLVYVLDGRCRFWQTESLEIEVWKLLHSINASPTVKVMQNGGYDSAYFARYRIPPANYFLDTAHIFHSLWPEAPKRLDFVASVACDFYRFWKDEANEGDKEDDKKLKLPTTPEGYKKYWRYNALDSHYTTLATPWCLKVLLTPQNQWALRNYVSEMRRVLGPGFAMTMRGFRLNAELQTQFLERNMRTGAKELVKLRTMVDDMDYNPRSAPQTARIIYDVLKAKPLRGKGRTTNEKILDVIRSQSPLLDLIIRQIWAYKKPINNASKYGANLAPFNHRWMYTLKAGGTETGRFSSSEHPLWVGTQIQNPPYAIRPMIEPDEGYILVRVDYRKSDLWFTAFASENPQMMKIVQGDKDAHCFHTAEFFKKPYEEIYQAYERDESWITHNVTGLRNISKRIGFGANYLMGAYTLFITMGYESVVAAAKSLGFINADNWELNKLVKLCQVFLNTYFTKLYPGLLEWTNEEAIKTKMRGNKATCYGGYTRTFFGDVVGNNNIKRELAAFHGQGGTAGNINAALENLYWLSDIEERGFILLSQIHDEIDGQVPKANLSLVADIIKLMENRCTLHERDFIVPVEAEVGLGFGKRMMKWHPEITIKEIEEHDAKWWEKNFPNGLN